jgi:hydrogenase maturation protease
VLVIGFGTALRGDDAAGTEVARRLKEAGMVAGIEVREHQGHSAALLEAWNGRDKVLLVDTMRSGLPAGTIWRWDASRRSLPAQLRGSTSTHAFAVSDAIELGRALGRLPPRVIVYAVEGRAFGMGSSLSDVVSKALPGLAAAVWRDAISLSVFQRPQR